MAGGGEEVAAEAAAAQQQQQQQPGQGAGKEVLDMLLEAEEAAAATVSGCGLGGIGMDGGFGRSVLGGII